MEYNFALLIDGENLSCDVYSSVVVKELENLGNIQIKKVYADFHNAQQSWYKFAGENGLTTVQASALIKGKNTTDICLAIDAIDIAHKKRNNINAFCIVTSDSDFAILAQKLKERGKFVVIVGKYGTPLPLQNSADKFISFDINKNNTNHLSQTVATKTQLSTRPTSTQPTKSPQSTTKNTNNPTKNGTQNNGTKQSDSASKLSSQEIKNMIKDCILKVGKNGVASYSNVVNLFVKQYPTFDYTKYGASKKTKKPFFAQFAKIEGTKNNMTIKLL